MKPLCRLPEKTLQRQIKTVLSALGYTVLETGTPRRATNCPACHRAFTPHGGNQNSKGVPDLLVTRPQWPEATFLGVELKGEKTPLSPEQAWLCNDDRIVIVRSVSQAVDAVQRAEGRYGCDNPRIRAFWASNPHMALEPMEDL